MANKIVLKKSSVTGRVPSTSDLDYGELALNYSDGKLYFKNSSNVINAFKVNNDLSTVLDRRLYTVSSAGTNTFAVDYEVGFVDVYVNGVKLNSSEFTATDGLNVTITALVIGDEVQLNGFRSFTYGDISTRYIRQTYTATAGQTTFNIEYSRTSGIAYVQVFVNGVLLDTAEYTATSGTSIVLTTAASVGDIVECIGLNDFQIFDLLTSGTGLSYDNNTGTISLNSATTAIANTVALRDGSGNLTANTFTGALSGNASTATTLQTARTINGVSFNGSANISFGTDSVTEGSTNLYFTNARAQSAISGTSPSLTNLTVSGYLRGPSTFTIDPAAHGDDTGTVVIAGNLQVDGTTTTINSTTLTVDDKNIVLASGAANAAAADGAGITIDGASASLTYSSSADGIIINKRLRITEDGTNTITIGQWDASTNRVESVGRSLFLTSYDGSVQLGIDGSADLTVAADRKVGIGTATPTQKLTVAGRANFDSQNNYYGAWVDGNTTGNSWFAVGQWYNVGGRIEAGGSDMHIYTHNTSHNLSLQKDGGKVGVGTYSPTHTLDVRGDVVIKGNGSPQHAVLRFRRSDSTTDFGYIGFEDPTQGNSNFLITSVGNGNPLKLQAGEDDSIYFYSGTTSLGSFVKSIPAKTDVAGLQMDNMRGVAFDQSGTRSHILYPADGYLKYSAGDGNGGIALTSSAKLIVGQNGARPVTISPGNVMIKGESGGWSLPYGFRNQSDVYVGGFGMLGNNDSVSNFWVGPDYNNNYMTWDSSAVKSNRPHVSQNGYHWLQKELPQFNFGQGGITDEYLVLAKLYDGTIINSSGVMGEIIAARGSTSSGNATCKTRFHVTCAYNNNRISEFTSTGGLDQDFYRIDIITIDGVKYYAAKGRTTGGEAHLGISFSGWIINNNASNLLTRVRSSDANVTVVQTGVAYPAHVVNNNTNNLYFEVGGGSKAALLQNGNFGIGTDNPAAKLSVSGSNSSSTPLLDLTASGTGTFQRGVRLLNSGMNAGDHIMYAVGRSDNTRNMGQFYFYYAGDGSTSNRVSMGLHSVDDVFNILGSGYVGIGITSPTYKLDVANDMRIRTTYGIVFKSLGNPIWGSKMFMGGDIGSTQKGWMLGPEYAGSGTTDFVLAYSTNDQGFGGDPSALTYSNVLRLTGSGTLSINGNTVIHAGNIQNYAATSGSGGVSTDINGGNLNINTQTGFYRGSAVTGAPDTGWFYFLTQSHDNNSNAAAGWTSQMAIAYGAGNTSYSAGEMAIRVRTGSTTWNGWRRVLDTSNYSSYALPLSGGTVSGATRIDNRLVMGGYNNSNGYIAFNNAGTYWGLIGNYGTNDWRLAYGGQDAITGWSLKWDASGNVAVNGTFTESSTRRIKKNIRPITGALDIVNKLQGVIYDRIDGEAQDEPGLIAEDTDEVLNNLVVYDDEGKPAGIKYTKTVAYLIEAVKELTAKVNALEAK